MRIPASLRRETVVVTPYLGSGAYGPIYGSPTTYAPPYKGVYIEPGNRQAVDSTGKEVVANATAFFDGDVPIGIGDLCEWQGRRYAVIDAQPQRPFGRTNHVEVLLQSTEDATP